MYIYIYILYYITCTGNVYINIVHYLTCHMDPGNCPSSRQVLEVLVQDFGFSLREPEKKRLRLEILYLLPPMEDDSGSP